MSNINISVTEQDPINVSIASPEVQNVDISAQSISATVTDGDKGDIVVTGGGTVWTLDPNALATLVPYTGATSDVNLGEFGLLTGNLEFDTSPTNAPTAAGSVVWNDTEGTLDLMLKGASVNLPIGQKQVVRAVNGTGGNLTRAQYRVVKITGAQGQRLQVSLARADNDANSKDTIGIVGEDISNNQTGFIVSSGLIEEINTTGSLQGETWTDGDTLYLSGTTFGVITNVKPAAPIHTVILGFVVYAHSQHGKIYVKVDNGYELTELHDVNTLTAASGDYLRYNGTTWVDATISAADLPSAIDAAKIGAGLVSNTEFGYLDGVTSAIQTQLNGKQATLTNPVTGTGASGQVSFFNGTSTVTGDNGLFWDNTNKRLGVGTVSPAYIADITGTLRNTTSAYFATSSGGVGIGKTSVTSGLKLDVNGSIGLDTEGTGGSLSINAYGVLAGSLRTPFDGVGYKWLMVNAVTNGSILFGIANVERARITAAGRLLLGTTTESTYLLDVAGDIRNTTSAYFATASGNVGIGTTTASGKLHVYQNAFFDSIIDPGRVQLNGYLLTSSITDVDANSHIRINTTVNSGRKIAFGITDQYGGLIQSYTTQTTPHSAVPTSINPYGGNVGIGTTNPLWKLTVRGSDIILDAATGEQIGMIASNNYAAIVSNRRLELSTPTNTDIRLRIHSATGNIGIGELTDNGYRLDIGGTLRNSTSAYFATSSGNVGVGQTSATYKLDVVGDIRASQRVIASGNLTPASWITNSVAIGYSSTNGHGWIAAGGASDYVPLVLYGNVGIAQTTFGTSATRTFAIASGTAPSTSPADAFQLYSADITAGNAAPHFRTEGGAVVKIYQQTTGVGAATRVGGGGTTVTDTDTFDGYTLNQIVKALRNAGFLA